MRFPWQFSHAQNWYSATQDEQSHQQVDPAATARGLTSPARLFSFVSFVLPFIRLVAAGSRAGLTVVHSFVPGGVISAMCSTVKFQ